MRVDDSYECCLICYIKTGSTSNNVSEKNRSPTPRRRRDPLYMSQWWSHLYRCIYNNVQTSCDRFTARAVGRSLPLSGRSNRVIPIIIYFHYYEYVHLMSSSWITVSVFFLLLYERQLEETSASITTYVDHNGREVIFDLTHFRRNSLHVLFFMNKSLMDTEQYMYFLQTV
jgi:hypothetical protein